MASASWTELAAKHYYQDKGGDAPSFVVARDMAPSDLRAFLSYVASLSDSYVPVSENAALTTWPAYAVKRRRPTGGENAPGFRFSYLCAPGDEVRVGRLAAEVLAPCAERTAALLREATGRPNEPLDVVFVAGRSTRQLPSRPGGPIAPEHINGGVTFFAYSPLRVLVWREEDAEKVLVHELVHRFGLDHALSGERAEQASRALATRHGVTASGPRRDLSEAYTEAMACMLHAHLFAARQGPRPKPAEALSIASAHFITVAARLALHFGLPPERPFAYKESTHAFAYVACRAALFQPRHLERLLLDHPPGSPPADADAFARRLDAALADLRRELSNPTTGRRNTASRSLAAVALLSPNAAPRRSKS